MTAPPGVGGGGGGGEGKKGFLPLPLTPHRERSELAAGSARADAGRVPRHLERFRALSTRSHCMHSAIPLLCLTGLLICCQTRQHQAALPPPATAELRSPVSLRDAVLTLPSDALSGSTRRQEILREKFIDTDDERLRRISFSNDNP